MAQKQQCNLSQINMTKYTCLKCGKESGTKIICEECRINLTKYEIRKYDIIWRGRIIELGGNQCVNCGLSAETDSGLLCGDHLETKGAMAALRYDLENGLCRCADCHTKRGNAEIPIIPSPPTMEKKKKSKKTPMCSELGCTFTGYFNGKCDRHKSNKKAS